MAKNKNPRPAKPRANLKSTDTLKVCTVSPFAVNTNPSVDPDGFPRAELEALAKKHVLCRQIRRYEQAHLLPDGTFNNSLNNIDGEEGKFCNNCHFFQHDLHERFWCKAHHKTRLFMTSACDLWSYWEPGGERS